MIDKARNNFIILLESIQYVGLFLVAAGTVMAMVHETMTVIRRQSIELGDILLMFIYLEVLAMVVVYVKSHKLPVRMPLYIGIVALARHLTLDMKEMHDWQIIAVAVSALFLALTVLVVRFGHVKFPYPSSTSKPTEQSDSEIKS